VSESFFGYWWAHQMGGCGGSMGSGQLPLLYWL